MIVADQLMVNQRHKETAEAIADIVDNCSYLFVWEVNHTQNLLTFLIKTDLAEVEYRDSLEGIISLLLHMEKISVTPEVRDSVHDTLVELGYRTRKPGRLGTKHSTAALEKMRIAATGKRRTEESIEKQSAARKGYAYGGKKGIVIREEAKENIRRGIREKRYTPELGKLLSESQQGERNNQAVLNWKQVKEIRAAYAAGGVSQQKIADQYGVHRSTIADIVTGRTWQE